MPQSVASCANCTDPTTTTTVKAPTTTNVTKTTTKPKVNATDNGSAESQHQHRGKSTINSLLTRTRVYHILGDLLKKSGYNGEPCLLSLICETNFSSLGEVNGILGTLVHILFSPSTSEYENLPLSYYQAEVDGAHGFCEHYAAECEENPLHLISARLGDIIDDFMSSK
ncbi:uncharacterized protein LOC118753113 [Rhagoletis pomonella]|uniref:uncharacterized protein LOC118753113 n=1 Tax=Rhagoletis pomonella TaxID=28610 RepID=UPI00177B4EA6|nr:uncharacterized protein LOC118753113 [Rhagoletis pomonella]